MEARLNMNLQKILNNLQKVKRTSDGKYIACCPAHNDRTASLAINDNGDGRILLNCFAGCDTYSILNAIGLDWSDVMPESAIGHTLKPVKTIIYATEALSIIKFETQVILAIAFEMKKRGLADNDMIERLDKAMQTIHKAMEASNVKI